jgi:hypothetical protein
LGDGPATSAGPAVPIEGRPDYLNRPRRSRFARAIALTLDRTGECEHRFANPGAQSFIDCSAFTSKSHPDSPWQ